MRCGGKVWFIDKGKIYYGIINEEHTSYYDISSRSRQHCIPAYHVFYTEKEAKQRLQMEGHKRQNWFIRVWNYIFGV